MKELIENKLIEIVGLNKSDSIKVASAIIKWIEKETTREKVSPKIEFTKGFIQASEKDGKLQLTITESQNILGFSILNSDFEVKTVIFGEINI
jgi:hypothetical protein